jgi:hypothetical protein
MIIPNPENLLTMSILIAGSIFAIGLVGLLGYAAFFNRH